MVVKRPIIPIIDQSPISRLCPKLARNFIWQPERTCNAKGTESKRSGKKERKEAKKKKKNWNWWSNQKKERNQVQILAMYMHQIEILQIFVLNLREIYLFGTK